MNILQCPFKIANSDVLSFVYESGVESKGGVEASTKAPIVLLVHGAGFSAHTWTLSLQHCRHLFPEATRYISYDLLGHGQTLGSVEPSLDNLVHQLALTINACVPLLEDQERLFLIGHSLGGAVIAKFTKNVQSLAKTLGIQLAVPFGLAIIDIVEAAALDNLLAMKSFCMNRPREFADIDSAINWMIEHRMIKNRKSAELSVPSLLRRESDGSSESVYSWINDWTAGEPYWEEWFTDLSNNFISSGCNKLLVLAESNRLMHDKKLMIGQMQGKFQVSMISSTPSTDALDHASKYAGPSGHCVQEDQPEQLARILHSFWERFSASPNFASKPIPFNSTNKDPY